MFKNKKWTSFLILVIFLGAPISAQIPQSEHFTVERLADGVFAVIAKPGGGAVSNAGVVDLGGATLIFDTLMSHKATSALIIAAESLTSSPITYVVNSHYHKDHTWGNQIFPPDVKIISTPWTREAIQKSRPQKPEADLKTYASELPKLRARLESLSEKTDKLARDQTLLTIGYSQAVLDTLPQLIVVQPNLTFDRELTIYGTRRKVKLMTFGKGSTGSDLVLFLPDDRIVFTGDLVMVGMHPYITESSPKDWMNSLRELQALNIISLVPGHGPTGDSTAIPLMMDYIEGLVKDAMALVEKEALDEISAPVPAPFQSWFYPEIYQENLKYMYNLLQKEK
jgi:glyoxylase-like metal-dependent hydrolase (beta-lactamase superfamily II)